MGKSEAVKVTISRSSSGLINLRVKDESSTLPIVELAMTPEDFAECVTGVAFCPGTASFMPNEFTVQRYGMKAITKHVECRRPKSTENTRDVVVEDFTKNWAPHNWELFDDGVRTQQNGKEHNYVIRKFITQAEAAREAAAFKQ